MSQRALCVFDRPVQSIAQEFNKCGFRYHEVPYPLYAHYIDLYKKSEILHDKMAATMNDGEHRLLMEEGRRDGFQLPPDDYLDVDLKCIKKALNAFDPYHARSFKNGNIKLSAGQIQGFFTLFSAGYDMFHTVAEAVRHTDYLKLHRYMRDERGIKYAGPTALQELVNVYIGVAKTNRQQINYLQKIIPEFTL